MMPLVWIIASDPYPDEWLYDEHSYRLALIGLAIGQWDRLSKSGRTKAHLEELFWGSADNPNDPEEHILSHIGSLMATHIPHNRFPRMQELAQETLLGQHVV